jgi:hypothetical protein
LEDQAADSFDGVTHPRRTVATTRWAFAESHRLKTSAD